MKNPKVLLTKTLTEAFCLVAAHLLSRLFLWLIGLALFAALGSDVLAGP